MWSRRDFIKAAGVGFMGTLLPREAFALDSADAVFASSILKPDGSFGAALVSERGDLIRTIDLPGRGHDVTQSPLTGQIVVFARRPGTFAFVFDGQGTHLTITSPAGRHFYGHGKFSPDGKLLYATENDFDAGRGKIGIYDATDGFTRIGEWESGGIGPHDMMLSLDGRLLCVANGGIDTHPDYGRAKLNLATMQPNLSWIDRDNGQVVATHTLPEKWHQLSTRHLTPGPGNSLWFASQYQGPVSDPVPMLGRIRPDEDILWIELPDDARASLRNYVGSIASNPDGSRIALGSPVGNSFLVVDDRGQVITRRTLDEVCGVADHNQAFTFSTGTGLFGTQNGDPARAPVGFDHHLLPLRV